MGVSFADHPMFKDSGFGSPASRFEADIYDCEVEGQIPSDIHGTFFRMQCDFQYPPPKNEWATGFNGDGHICGFTFKNGRASYKGRYIMTDRLKAERAARRRLYGVYRNRYTDDPSVAKLNRSAANTHLYWHGGKLLALKEDSLPWEIDPHTYESKGPWDFHGKYKGTSMSAHPKIDPVTGEMICYGYQAKGDLSNDIVIYTVGKDGHIKHEIWFKMPYVGMVHDIAITQKHVIVPVVGNVTSEARLKSGEPMWQWDVTKPTMCAVVPRDGETKDVRWFKGPNRSTLHFHNAVTNGNRIEMELPVSETQRAPSQIRRWTFDLNSKDDSFGEDPMVIGAGLLPRMDDRYLSLPYKYGYVGTRDADTKRNLYQKFDIHKGVVATYTAPANISGLQENSFVPRVGSTAEGDGYIMGVAMNSETMESEVHIVDANKLEQGAVAIIKMPFRLRGGTHTNWYSGTDLKI
ncbi:MAG: carotenoid oxygenase family protein [Caulobacteraceae bacterium]